jgi:hypothetical protein
VQEGDKPEELATDHIAFQAPEIRVKSSSQDTNNRPLASAKQDVWALGMVFWGLVYLFDLFGHQVCCGVAINARTCCGVAINARTCCGVAINARTCCGVAINARTCATVNVAIMRRPLTELGTP